MRLAELSVWEFPKARRGEDKEFLAMKESQMLRLTAGMTTTDDGNGVAGIELPTDFIK